MDYESLIKKLKAKYHDMLGENVAEKMGEAGYPNLGAGVATAASLADTFIPDTKEELAMTALNPVGAKLGKMFKANKSVQMAGKQADNIPRPGSFANIFKDLDDVSNRFKQNPKLLDHIRQPDGSIRREDLINEYRRYGIGDDGIKELGKRMDQIAFNVTKVPVAPSKVTNSMEKTTKAYSDDAAGRVIGTTPAEAPANNVFNQATQLAKQQVATEAKDALLPKKVQK